MTVSPSPQILAQLEGGPLPYVLRRSARARGLRVVIDPERGVVVTVPAADRRGWGRPEPRVESFLRQREAWLRRHLARLAGDRASVAALGGVRDGALLPYRGELHRLRVEAAPPGLRRTSVVRIGGDGGDEIAVRIAPADRRPIALALEAWFRERARLAIEEAIARHGGPLGVVPAAVAIRDQRTRWGSASRHGRLSFSWRLVLAPPEALETVVIHELAHLRVFGHGRGFWELVASRRPDHRMWRRWLRDNGYGIRHVLANLDDPQARLGVR